MSSTLTDSGMLERRCHDWEKTRQRGQFRYAVVRGVILCGFWFLVNIIGDALGLNKMSFESLAITSIVFFLMGCWEAPQSWNRAERRYQTDKNYLEAMKSQNSNTPS